MKVVLLSLFVCAFLFCNAQKKFTTVIKTEPNEKWWGGIVGLGANMPYSGNVSLFDLGAENRNNQNVPLFVSSTGRYIWSDKPFAFKVENNELQLFSDYEELQPIKAGKTLKDAYLAASKKHFPATGKIPEPIFFSVPQYNTWIELQYNQNQIDIIEYADNILKNNFPAGVLMIDDNWQKYYGNFEFKPERFSDAKKMIDYLHQKGFKVMVWICPFVSPDSPEYRDLQNKGYLIKQKGTNKAAIIEWWNGFSACYDLSNPDAMEHLKNELKKVQKEYGIDGFKFDAGDVGHYNNPNLEFYDKNFISVDMTEKWLQLGLEFPFNEYRAGWKMGLEPLVQRLGDKNYSWRDLQILIPDMIAAGLLGQVYTCPDMIGGGQIGSFFNIDYSKINQDLIVRSCQVHALMPMMQFSVAPWRILSQENLDICVKYARLHEQFGEYILEMAHHASLTGEPIVRHMEYSFPHQGFVDCKDQYMLGNKYLVAPIVAPENEREVKLPKGKWKDEDGKIFKGPRTIKVKASLERLPYYELIK